MADRREYLAGYRERNRDHIRAQSRKHYAKRTGKETQPELIPSKTPERNHRPVYGACPCPECAEKRRQARMEQARELLATHELLEELLS